MTCASKLSRKALLTETHLVKAQCSTFRVVNQKVVEEILAEEDGEEILDDDDMGGQNDDPQKKRSVYKHNGFPCLGATSEGRIPGVKPRTTRFRKGEGKKIVSPGQGR